MNLAKLFSTQKALRDRIDYNGTDRLDKLELALLVEVGECANEWRGFKFWSTDQKSRKKPLLVEYVDGFHFVLELGIEIEVDYDEWEFTPIVSYDITKKFTDVFESIIDFKQFPVESEWVDVYEHYLGLGEMLGFSRREVENAYFEKNKINHQRQADGY